MKTFKRCATIAITVIGATVATMAGYDAGQRFGRWLVTKFDA